MATTTPAVDLVDDADQQITRIALARVRVGPNTRTVTDDDVATMAGSIELQGQLTPVFVYPVDGDPDHDYELDGGETRYRALVQLGATHINAIVRASGRASAAAAENFSRSRPDPLAEARAVRRMMVEDGLTQAGAAQAAGLGRARVAAVLKILDLPQDAQTLVGQGVISLAAVDALLAVGEASTTLLDATIAHLVKHPRDSAELARNPGWFISRSVASTRAAKAFAVGVGRLTAHDLQRIALGKKVEALFAEVETLERKVLSYAHAHVEISLDDLEVDQARAAGVLLELGNHTLITDRDLYRELLLAAMNRKKETLTGQLAAKERANAKDSGKPAVTPEEAAERARRAALRGACDDAHGVNLDIGASLTRGLAEVDPADMNVARFMVYALLGPTWDGSVYTGGGERIRSIAAGGIRLVVESLRTDITRTVKGGGRGRLRIDYGKDPQPAIDYVWAFLDGATTAGELYGRALVVIAADRYAQRMVLPAAKQGCRERWFSREDRAVAALEAIAKPHLPASLAQLEAAVAEAHATYERTCAQAREAAAAAAAAAKAKKPARPRTRGAAKKTPAAKPAAPAGDTAA